MTNATVLAGTAARIGDPARANILTALLDGCALTATELAHTAGISAQAASGHLAKLVDGRLLSVARQGRHRYFRLVSREVAGMLEGIMVVAAVDPDLDRTRATPRVDPALKEARTCYDHLAGRLGVAIAETLVARDLIVLGQAGGEPTEAGRTWLDRFGIPGERAERSRRPFCRPCLDWSERRPHLAGRPGPALCRRCEDLGWIERIRGDRTITVTEAGRRGLEDAFGYRADQDLRGHI
ncbi:winged helix-turn-helix domain-containing protein [Methylobacterium sp. C1]|uniref:ArsR/SmtB family transcription factor n=1 Tax=Methylobacterium sp. C1 TaxID=1479019 RepID=UPI0008DB1684|nr:winged helix-turn-helix domain-containing protein [Methylobacterium sp. C1]